MFRDFVECRGAASLAFVGAFPDGRRTLPGNQIDHSRGDPKARFDDRDCDVNGYRTYYFAGYTRAAGSGPATWILALLFDEAGRPVPFFVTTRGGYDAKGIENILHLDGSGPELLEQSYWATSWTIRTTM